ncbi:MAG: polysaccharide deacetylase family protein [Deltaproteobacteria bacterium]|nr:polysaccharide deacetylase family protein [Deltaproteobacteria bacterium]
MRLCALSVDLDEVPCYHAIHGLPPASGPAAHAVYADAVPRFRALFKELGVPGTFFVIGQDLEDDLVRERLRGLLDDGHELSNHSLSHRYDLTRLPPGAQRDEVQGGIAAMERALGVRPVGFRAPGYTLTDGLLAALRDLKVSYDSSVFPCPAYWGAKAGAIGWIALRGRESRSVVDNPSVLLAPADPYRAGTPYWKPGPEGPLEFPIGVTRGVRLPYIGTSVMLAGRRGAPLLTAQMDGRPLVNLELHGMDLLEAADGLGYLERHQPDLRVPLATKEAILRGVVTDLRRRGYGFVTLARAAEVWATR